MLFFSTDALAFSNAHFGAGNGPIHLHIVSCTGRETNLTDCPEVRSHSYCLQDHSEDAGVRCQGLENIVAFELFVWLYEYNLLSNLSHLKSKIVLPFCSYSYWKLYLW